MQSRLCLKDIALGQYKYLPRLLRYQDKLGNTQLRIQGRQMITIPQESLGVVVAVTGAISGPFPGRPQTPERGWKAKVYKLRIQVTNYSLQTCELVDGKTRQEGSAD